ncbi:MAG: WYL domain-containing protein [Deltaproteobacteria bacterium]|nr:WYL domain-containing protein [Deltaproteobacteria bacterium]
MQSLIEQAIREKRLLKFTYSGHPRIVEPHVLGVNGGVTQFLGYQVDGSSSSGSIPAWRRFDIPRISGISIREGTFSGPRTFPSGKHSSWDNQIAIVS